jgi:ligand-binding SRPBCC domain-containing protein
MPPATETRLDQLHLVPPTTQDSGAFPHAAGIGSIIVTSFRLLPFLPVRAQWIARITEFEWNYYFADVQQKGLLSNGITGTSFWRKPATASAAHSSAT